MAWPLAAVVAVVASVAATQTPQPVFRAEAHVVTQGLTMVDKNGPIPGLTAAEFSLVIEKKYPVPVGVSESPDKPGSYILSFNPPVNLRDGKSHRVDVKIKLGGKWRTLPLNWKVVFPKSTERWILITSLLSR
jgi:hypothetical protein